MRSFLILLLLLIPNFVFGKLHGQALIDSIVTILPNQKNDTNKVRLLSKLTLQYYNVSNEEGLKYGKQGLELATQLGWEKGKAMTHNVIGVLLDNKSDFQDALDQYAMSYKIVKILNDKWLLSIIFNNIGLVYMHQSDYSKAILYYDSSLSIRAELNDKEGEKGAYNNIGLVYDDLARYPDALQSQFKALKIEEELNDTIGLAATYNNVGIIYMKLGNYDDALKNEFISLEFSRKLKLKGGMANSYDNIGSIYNYQKKMDQALKSCQESLKLRIELGEKSDMADAYSNIAGIYLQLNKLPEALSYYNTSLDLYNEIGNKNGIASSEYSLGAVLILQHKFPEAKSQITKGLTLGKEIGAIDLISNASKTLSDYYAETNKFDSSLAYYKIYIDTRDTIYNQENTRKEMQSQLQYEFDKKEAVTQLEQEKKLGDEKTRTLWIFISLMAVVFVAILMFINVNFKSRVQKKVDVAKRKFFDNVVHEVRTPLSMIQGPIKVLQEKIHDPELSVQLDIAERNTNRLNELINQMLTIAKIDASRYVLNEGIGNLPFFVDTLWNQYKIDAEHKHITLHRQFDCMVENVLFDKDALEKIIGNLLSNAIKYTPEGGSVGLDFSTIDTNDGLCARFDIWDSGLGISEQDQTQIFKRFYRANDKTGTTKGTGIGLSLAQDLVLLMKGTIEVQSATGKGSVFTVKLPLKQIKNADDGEKVNNGNTILLVEDNPDILEFNRRLLKGKGYEVLTATDGIDAVTIMQQQIPDLVVTDLMMPGKDGLSLIKDIRANANTATVPVIILSAKSSVQSKLEGIGDGAQAYLAKPFQPEELLAIVKSQLLILPRSKTEPTGTEPVKSIEEQFASADPFSRKCYQLIQQHLSDSQLSVELLSDLMHTNRSHFQRKIKASTGYSPSELIRAVRLEKAKVLLLKKEGNISEVAYTTGFSSPSYFGKCYLEYFGYSPSQEAA